MEDSKHIKTDCREEDGITVGLIDSLISIARILAKRDFKPESVQEALKDLRSDKDIAKILEKEN
jgi:hypothetical protein